MKRFLIKEGKDWILPIDDEILRMLDIDPEYDYLRYLVQDDTLIIKKMNNDEKKLM